MGVIDRWALTRVREAMRPTFDAKAVIERNVAGTWTTVATEPCSFAQTRYLPQENPSQTQRLFIDDRWHFRFYAGTDVRFQDRLVVGARSFEVIQVPTPSTEISRLVIAQELTA